MGALWTAAQRTELDQLLRRCVECGLCLPHCATWLETGNEVYSPRGRLLLLADYLNQDGTVPEAEFQAAMDLCIGCMACTAACPSGVPFTLLEQGQRTAADSAPPLWVRKLDAAVLLRPLGRLAGLLRGLLRTVLGGAWRSRLEKVPLVPSNLARLLGSVPFSPRGDQDLVDQLDKLVARAAARPAGKAAGHQSDLAGPGPDPRGEGPLTAGQPVVFFRGCANAGLLPGTSARLRALLTAAGCRLAIPSGQDCCGAVAEHTGRPGRAAGLARRNRSALGSALTEGALLVVEAAGCSLQLKRADGPVADQVIDAGVLLDRLDLPALGPVPLRVVYHDPCHARHGQGIHREPRLLLQRIPQLEVVDPAEAEVCCGGGGVWGLLHPELSDRLGRRKAAHLLATGADLIVTGNPGCQGQIQDALAQLAAQVPILPLSDLVWYAWRRGQGDN